MLWPSSSHPQGRRQYGRSHSGIYPLTTLVSNLRSPNTISNESFLLPSGYPDNVAEGIEGESPVIPVEGLKGITTYNKYKFLIFDGYNSYIITTSFSINIIAIDLLS
jgi:hypothetical protein